MSEQPNFYAVIPATVRYCEHLMPNAKLLYAEITALANQRGYCYASNAYFANLYHVEERQIRRWLSQLVDFGFVLVKIDKNAGNQRNIYVKDALPLRTKKTSPTDKKDLPLRSKKTVPTDEKDLHNSKVILQVNNVRTSDEKNQDFENQKNEKPPQMAPRPPKRLFAETHYATQPLNFWAAIQQQFPHVPKEADFYHYQQRCLDWSDTKQARSDDWVKIAAKFILDDQRRGELHIYQQPQSKQPGHANNNRNQPGPTQQPIDSASLVQRSRAIAERLGYKVGE